MASPTARTAPKAKPPTEQDQHNAAQIAAATSFTAYVRLGMAPQTLTGGTLLEAAMLALIMHRDCAAISEHPIGLPTVYAMPPHGGPGTLVPLGDWLPLALARLAHRSAGAYRPHPDIARQAALLTA